jgi:hypothetical protein
MRKSSTPKQGKSTSDNRKPTVSPVRPEELTSVTAGYRLWLAKQPLSVNTRRTYLGRVRQYCDYLETSANDYGDPLSDPHARDYAIRDFKTHLKKARKAKPASVNLMLAALDHLYLFLGLGRPKVRREDLPQEAPKALELVIEGSSHSLGSSALPAGVGITALLSAGLSRVRSCFGGTASGGAVSGETFWAFWTCSRVSAWILE